MQLQALKLRNASRFCADKDKSCVQLCNCEIQSEVSVSEPTTMSVRELRTSLLQPQYVPKTTQTFLKLHEEYFCHGIDCIQVYIVELGPFND